MPDFEGIPEKLTGSLQENVLTLAASSDKFCRLVVLNIPLELYSNRVMRDLATQVYNYISMYSVAPKDHLPDLVEEKLEGENGEVLRQILENIHALQANFNEQFVVNQLNKFVRQQHLKKAVVGIIEAAEKGDTERADTVIDGYRGTSYAQFNPGLTLKEFVGDLGKVDRTLPCVPTGIPELDRAELGPARGELHLFVGPMKRGKTWWLLHLTKQALLHRLPTVYITLEVSPQIIAGRLLQSFFGMTRRESDAAVSGRFDIDDQGRLRGIRVEEIAKKVALTSVAGMTRIKKAYSDRNLVARISEFLRIQSFPTGGLRIKELNAYLENLVSFERFMPAVVVVDMASLMYLDIKNYRLALGMVMKELRGIAVERNCAMVTASQSNRASLTARTITEGHAAEDISQIGIADVAITYNQTPEERELNVARLYVAVARNSVDKWSVGITQSYGTGQFCTGSVIAPAHTWESYLPRGRREQEAEDEDA